uniref:G_PROTEIN_RECEP_F1_2 domain-containing protein n=1 Tax=Trichuris muris TaxID=70415 RepID=A0A5S6QTF3_TRIMR
MTTAEKCFEERGFPEHDDDFWKACLRNLAITRVFTDVEATLFTVAYSILCGTGLLSNGLLIFVLFSDLKLRRPSDVFVLNLALSNFLLAALYIPFLWLPVNQGDFTHGLFFCRFANALPGSNIYCSTLTISVMAVDRYYQVVNMRRHSVSAQRHLISVLVAGLIWLLAFALSLPYLLNYDLKVVHFPLEYAQRFNKSEEIVLFTSCALRPSSCIDSGLNPEEEKSCIQQVELVVSVLQAVFLYAIPLIVLVVYCLKLTHFLQQNEQRIKQQRGLTKDKLLGCAKADKDGKLPSSAGAHSRNTRAIKLLFAMASSYALVWMPFQGLSLFISLRSSDWPEDTVAFIRRIDEAFKLISMLSICINPVIYGFMNKNLSKRLKALLVNK